MFNSDTLAVVKSATLALVSNLALTYVLAELKLALAASKETLAWAKAVLAWLNEAVTTFVFALFPIIDKTEVAKLLSLPRML